LPYAVPAVLYTLQNRLVFEALRCISPPQYQRLTNLKLFTTSAVYRIAMQRQLRLVQWLALLLLGLGMALATVPSGGLAEDESGNLWLGTGIMILVAWCSAIAGVLNEWLIKRSSHVLAANVWLYGYGVLASCIQLIVTNSTDSDRSEHLGFHFQGFGSLLPWLVVFCNAVLGQSIAFLFRYADSIVKLYAVCAAMGFTALVSTLVFGFSLHFHAAAGYLVSMISMCLYYAPPELLASTDSEILAQVAGMSAQRPQKASRVSEEASTAEGSRQRNRPRTSSPAVKSK